MIYRGIRNKDMSTLKVGTIQDHANSITALSINSAGVLTTGVKHAFYMYRNTAQTIKVYCITVQFTNKE